MKRCLYHFKMILFLAILVQSGCDEKTVSTENIDQLTRSQRDSLSLASLKKVDDYPIYMMTYYGDYGFSDYIKTGNASRSFSKPEISMVPASWGCTCFAAMGKRESTLLGRNFDWHYCIPLLLFTDPPDGYASVSMVDLEYFGYHQNNLPDSPQNRQRLLDTPWLPFDGMNEKGVAIGMMAIPHAESPFDARKKTIGEIEVLRLVLDYATSTEQAIDMIKRYNVRIDTPPIHYLIADGSGHSAIIEFVNNAMTVIENNQSWQVSTNFIIHESGAPANVSCWRYSTAYNALKDADGIMPGESAMNLLRDVAQSSTIWSMVYEMNSDAIQVAVGRKFDQVKSFKLMNRSGMISGY